MIITSLLDTDLYKFTMMQCVFHHFPKTVVSYRFICKTLADLKPYISLIQKEIALLCSLKLTLSELEFLSTLPFMKKDFIAFLADFQLQETHIQLSTRNGFELIIQGPWLQTILFEVPLLAIINEIYYSQHFPHIDFSIGKNRLMEKIAILKKQANQCRFSDFGTRRRFSKNWHQTLLQILKTHSPLQLEGTSNLYFAKELNLRPIGTMAHEYLQACQVLSGSLKGSQKFAFDVWLKEYPDWLGIALTDVFTMDIFLEEFDVHLAKHYIGLRHDSGDPIKWGEKALHFYKTIGIDPRHKFFIFSDRLTFPKMIEIYHYFKGKCLPLFGIGTNLTNDVGYEPIDIVIKMTHANGQPVIKISDNPEKIVCEDPSHAKYVKNFFHLKD